MSPCRALVLALLSLAVPTASFAVWQADGTPVCSAVGYQDEPQIVADGAGGAILAWIDFDLNFAIYCQRIDASGNRLWAPGGIAVCTTETASFQLTSDGSGGVIIVWEDWRNGIDSDLYAQRINSAGVAQWTANGVALCTAANDQRIPMIAPDGAHGAVVTWFDYRPGPNTPDIYAQRLNAAGTPQWSANGNVVCAALNGQYNANLLGDGAGGATIIWSDWRNAATVADIYAQRLNGNGAAQWTGDGVAVCVSSGQQDSPLIVGDGTSGTMIAWEDHRPGTDGIYVQRLNASGSVQWTANGINLCAAPNAQTEPDMVADGAGGAIVAWKDTRNGLTNADIYTQRIDGAGQTAWTANGLALCTATGDQFNQSILSNDNGGMVAVWMDRRSKQIDGIDIYTQQLNTTGWPQLSDNGVVVCDAAYDQWFPVLVGVAPDRAITGWSDLRGNDQDIYAQLLDTGDHGTAVGDTPRAGLAILQNYPNPFSGGTEIQIQMARDGVMAIEVYDVAGRRVRAQRVDGGRAGLGSLHFDGRNDAGRDLPSGVYFYRVTMNGEAATHRMVILR